MALNFHSVFEEGSPSGFPSKKDCIYTPHFCEENIWMLLKKIQETCPEKLQFCYAVFISNEGNYIPLWRQASSKQEDGFIIWDYHVIMVYSDQEQSWVFDFDTQLPFPAIFSEYCAETFKSDDILKPIYYRFFRVISAKTYLQFFSSDRRHMQTEDGAWKMPPPNYPVIKNSEEVHNLAQYISMKEENNCKFGNVFNLNCFIDKFLVNRLSNLNYANLQESITPS